MSAHEEIVFLRRRVLELENEVSKLEAENESLRDVITELEEKLETYY